MALSHAGGEEVQLGFNAPLLLPGPATSFFENAPTIYPSETLPSVASLPEGTASKVPETPFGFLRGTMTPS